MEFKQIKIKGTWASVCAFYNHPDARTGLLVWLSVIFFVDIIMILVKFLETMDIQKTLVSLNDFRFIMPNVIGAVLTPSAFVISLVLHQLKHESTIVVEDFNLVLKRYGVLYHLLKNSKIPYKSFISIFIIKNRCIVIRYSGGIIEKSLTLVGHDQKDGRIIKLLEEKSGVRAKLYNSSNDIGAGKFIPFEP